MTADQQKVLQLLEEGEKSILELMAVCGYKKRESFRNSVLNDLIDRNIVAMTHPENISHRNQRYIKVDQGTGMTLFLVMGCLTLKFAIFPQKSYLSFENFEGNSFENSKGNSKRCDLDCARMVAGSRQL